MISIGNGTNVYGSTVTPGSVSFSNKLNGDIAITSTVSIENPIYSSSSNLTVNSYQQSVIAILGGKDASNYSLIGGFITEAKNYTVSPLALISNIVAASNIYGSPVTSDAVTFSNMLGGDNVTSSLVNIVSPIYSNSGNLVSGKYAQSITSYLGGADANNYTFSNGFTTLTKNYTVNQLATIVTAGSNIQQSTSLGNFVQTTTTVNTSSGLLFNFISTPTVSIPTNSTVESTVTTTQTTLPTTTSNVTPTINSDSSVAAPNGTSKAILPSIDPNSSTPTE